MVPASLALIAISGTPDGLGAARRELSPSPAMLAALLLGSLLVVALAADAMEARR